MSKDTEYRDTDTGEVVERFPWHVNTYKDETVVFGNFVYVVLAVDRFNMIPPDRHQYVVLVKKLCAVAQAFDGITAIDREMLVNDLRDISRAAGEGDNRRVIADAFIKMIESGKYNVKKEEVAAEKIYKEKEHVYYTQYVDSQSGELLLRISDRINLPNRSEKIALMGKTYFVEKISHAMAVSTDSVKTTTEILLCPYKEFEFNGENGRAGE